MALSPFVGELSPTPKPIRYALRPPATSRGFPSIFVLLPKPPELTSHEQRQATRITNQALGDFAGT